MSGLRVAGLFAGIGGIELGLSRAGHRTLLLCESWGPAQAVLRARFPDIPLEDDVRTLAALPSDTDLVTAGFPCQDLSQAGRAAGIIGAQSSLVEHVFRLLPTANPSWLLLENVPFMLQLDRGGAMTYLTRQLGELGYRWAYRIVDSRFTGVPQRRRRVVLLASRSEDPKPVLFADDAGEPPPSRYRDDAFGFYWTEGLTGLGWAQDATPTLKGGSALGIPSPPAIWVPLASVGRSFVLPSVEDTEALQGFPRGWTSVADTDSRKGPRTKLTGNAVTVGVATWLGERLHQDGDFDRSSTTPLEGGSPWPRAAWGEGQRAWAVDVSEYPVHATYQHLLDVVNTFEARPLSWRGASGFFSRTRRAKLRFDADFLVDLQRHIDSLAQTVGEVATA